MRNLVLCFLVVFSGWVAAHPGATDRSGGHRDRKAGAYHCHKEPCISNQAAVSGATSEAEVAGRDFSVIYNREDWPHWVDLDNDCQDARAEVLIAASLVPVKFKRNNGCSVSWGEWLDPYTGRVFTQASDLDIDHLVPLAHAHRNGGAEWSREKKRAFANDPDNLVVVDGDTNKDKSDKAPDVWMPPNREYHCSYLARWQAVKKKYGLVSSKGEAVFVLGGLANCSH